MRNFKDKMIYYFMVSITAIIFVIIISSLVVYLYPYKILTFDNDLYTVNTPIVKAGEQVEFTVELTKHTDIPGEISRQLINTYIYN